MYVYASLCHTLYFNYVDICVAVSVVAAALLSLRIFCSYYIIIFGSSCMLGGLIFNFP